MKKENSPLTLKSSRICTHVGWYLRKGLAPGIRGTLFKPRFRQAVFPFFLGSRCRIMYSKNISFGKRCYLGDNSFVNAFGSGIWLGDHVTLREGAWVQCSSSPEAPGGFLKIGSNTYVGPNAVIGVGGNVIIGEGTMIGAGLTLVAENHAIDENGVPSRAEVSRKGITLGNGVWLGHRVTILDGVTLGDGCIVGAGAVVTKSFPAKTMLVGVPARPVQS